MGDLDIRFYLSILWRRLPYVIAVVSGCTIAGIVLAVMLPAHYKASARVLVEAPQIPAEMARSTVPTSAVEQFEIIQQEALTQDSLSALASRQGVYPNNGAGMAASEIAADMRARLSFEQVELTTSNDGQGVTLYNVSFNAKQPDLAARVVNDLVESLLSKSVMLRTGRAGDTMQFFDQETKRLNAELTKVEAEILAFKNANKDALPDSLDFRRAQQGSQQDRLSQLEREEAGLRSRRENFVQLFKTTGRVANAGPITPQEQMLADMNRALADQLTIFSEDSPSIVALKARIAQLQNNLKSAEAAKASDGKAAPTELDFQLSDIDERLRLITQEKQTIEDNLTALAKSIAATPGNDTTLTSLTRNRANIQTQYNTATAMLAQASVGEQIEARSKGGRLTVIEPAVPPEKPFSPKRRRVAAMGLAVGMAAGLGLVVLLELLNKTIRRPRDLVALLQSQPLATIAYIPARKDRTTEPKDRRPDAPPPKPLAATG